MTRATLVATVVITGAAGCTRPRSASTATPDARAAPSVAATIPSFRSAVLPHLQKRCAQAEGCHGDKPTDSVDLDLRPAAAYQQLVNRAAKARTSAVRVKPGDPSASFLVAKLTGALQSREGKTMPLDADTGAPIEPVPTDPAFVERVLKPWIAAGAPNN